mmetsp:Transcript_34800/g.74244  ORF Transcript_34800/g.74244 Transcript_34800/m.74244 type:complete len:203 (-) Transcript_34800:476-1084(-)
MAKHRMRPEANIFVGGQGAPPPRSHATRSAKSKTLPPSPWPPASASTWSMSASLRPLQRSSRLRPRTTPSSAVRLMARRPAPSSPPPKAATRRFSFSTTSLKSSSVAMIAAEAPSPWPTKSRRLRLGAPSWSRKGPALAATALAAVRCTELTSPPNSGTCPMATSTRQPVAVPAASPTQTTRASETGSSAMKKSQPAAPACT